MSRADRDAAARVDAGDPWYIDEQLGLVDRSPGYQAIVRRRWHFFDREIRGWLDAHHLDRGTVRIIDAGCGDGINLRWLEELVRRFDHDAVVFGADYNHLRVTRAREIASSGLATASLINPPFRTNSFDIVMCNHVIEHVSEPAAVLHQLHEMLREDGLLIVGTPNEGCVLGRFRNHVIQRSILRTTDHVNFFTARSMRNLLSQAGFELIRMDRQGFFLPHTALQTRAMSTSYARRALFNIGRLVPSQATDILAVARRGGCPAGRGT